MSVTPTLPKNLQMLIEFVAANPGKVNLAPGRALNNLLSSMRQLASILNKDPAIIPADPKKLQPMLAKARPEAMGYKRSSLTTSVSSVRRAQRASGWSAPHARKTPHSAEWRECLTSLPARMRYGLTNFARWASSQGIEPAEVTTTHLARYIEARNEAMMRAGRQGLLNFTRDWSEAATLNPAWPQVPPPHVPRRTPYGVKLEQMPEGLRDGLNAYLAHRMEPVKPTIDLRNFTPKPKIKPSSAGRIREAFEQFVGSAVQGGVPLETLSSLAALFDDHVVRTAVQHQWSRGGDRPRRHLEQMVVQLIALGRTYLGIAPAVLERLEEIRKMVAPVGRVGSAKVKARMEQFERTENSAALLNLPATLMARADRMADPAEAAELAMTACAISLSINTLFRRANIADLRLDRHISSPKGPKVPLIRIEVPASEVKNAVDLHCLIDGNEARLVMRYRDRHRHHLAGAEGPYLFPGPGGGALGGKKLAHRMRTAIKRETGLDVNPHLLRTFGVSEYNRAHPGDVETPRRLLGHRSADTTMTHYLPNRDAVDLSAYHRVLRRIRDDDDVV